MKYGIITGAESSVPLFLYVYVTYSMVRGGCIFILGVLLPELTVVRFWLLFLYRTVSGIIIFIQINL